MKKLAKIISGAMSLVLTVCTVSNTAPVPLYEQPLAVASELYYGDTEYEVELKDVYITGLREDRFHKEISMILKDYDVYDYYNTIRVSLLSPEAVAFELNDDNLKVVTDWENSCKLYDQLDTGTVVTLKIVGYDKEDAESLKEALENNRSSYNSSFGMNYISSVRSLSIHYYGDINDDGVVDSFDIISYRKQLAGTSGAKLTEAQFLNADINFNNVIDEEDLQQVQDYLLGKTKEFNGVSEIGSIRLDNKVDIQSAEGTATDEKFAAAEMKLGIDLLKQCFDPTKEGEENLLISPLSISTALAMTANGADGKTRAEMEKLLGGGLTLEELNEYMAYYISRLPDEKKTKVYLADSIWFKDKDTFKVYDDFLETNKKFYGAQIYKTPFDDTTVSDVNSWVNQNTKGMIPSLLKKGSLTPDEEKEILMMLINTVYFESEWKNPYENSYDGKFTDLNGKEHNIKRMNSAEREYYDLGDADAFKKPYLNGEYSFVGILPKEKNIVDYVKDLDAEKLLEGLKEYEDPNTIDLYVMIPKFKYDYSQSLKRVLAAIGMPLAFDKELADFAKINDTTFAGAPELYIDDVLHKTRIEVTEKGTKAAAVTAVMMAQASGIMPQKKKVEIYLDRPFVYMIVDKNNVPLFIGAATKLEENGAHKQLSEYQ